MDSKFITDVQNCQKHHRNRQRTFGDDLMHSELPTAVPSTNTAHLAVSRRKPATKPKTSEQIANEIEKMAYLRENSFVHNVFQGISYGQNVLFFQKSFFWIP